MQLNGQKIAEIYEAEVAPLESPEEIEDLLYAIDDIDHKVDWYKKLKKNRSLVIDAEIVKLDSRIAKLRSVIQVTLEQAGHKSLNFPGVGSAGVRSVKGKWEITDEAKLLETLEKTLDSDEFGKIVIHPPKIVKKELTKALESLNKSGDMPDGLKESVSRTEDRSSLQVKIEKPKDAEEVHSLSFDEAATSESLEDMDGLDV